MRLTFLRIALILAAGWCPIQQTCGQDVFLAARGGKMLPVVKAQKARALVKVGDKLVFADGNSFAFHHVDEFLPLFIAVHNIKVSTHAIELMDAGTTFNHEFRFEASFDSPYDIKDAFLVLKLNLADGTKNIFVYEIGDIGPHQPHYLTLSAPLGFPLGEGRYTLHTFSGGHEVLNSEQPFEFREKALDHFVAKRCAGREDGPPTPLFGPTPEYPKAMMKARIKGSAIVHCTVRTNGTVLNPEVASATDPAFGEAAVAAIRQWRFIPRIKGGRATETEVNLPVNFDPPKEKD